MSIGLAVPDLASFHGVHRDDTIVVCGCGESLNELANPEQFVTIGVNDVGRRFDPTYLVVVNPRSQFSGDRFRYVEQSRARYLFTQLDLRFAHDRTVRFRLGRYGGTMFTDPGALHYTRNSPYVALCLAVHMGARRIGLVGVDFTDRHFFGGAGPHPLTAHLEGIDAEYRQLAGVLEKMGVEVVNLSRVSRLTAFPKASQSSLRRVEAPASVARAAGRRPKIFGVNYHFLACGNVFTEGLRHAADTLGVEWCDASWDDPRLPERVANFAPDLVLVVHGRRFVQRWRQSFAAYRTAVWLLDEPYEVDDTSAFSSSFDHVFVNDPATLDRHRAATYLPVCHDPAIHYSDAAVRPHDVGFIGGANPTRERMLAALASRGLLSYVVGGPWRQPNLAARSRGVNLPARAVADLYRATKIVVNVFRDRHHYNRAGAAATSMNPRIYEALACGALVVSEARPEITGEVPELPVFRDEAELVAIVERYLTSPAELEAVRASCAERLKTATYAARLTSVIATTLGTDRINDAFPASGGRTGLTIGTRREETTKPREWEVCEPVAVRDDGHEVELHATRAPAAGSERGLVTTRSHRGMALSFDVWLSADSCFIAKINQQQKLDQCANSYHLLCDAGSAYLARHFCVFRTFELPCETWISLRLTHDRGVLSVAESDRLIHSTRDALLPEGFAVLSVKRGTVRLRNTLLSPAAEAEAAPTPIEAPIAEGELLVPGDAALQPHVSIVTTVYDRVEALGHCIRSVRAQRFYDYEHVIVSDCPAPDVVQRIAALVRSFDDGRISYLNLPRRHNNWGIAPAAAGLRRTRGQYVCFLSDDNGYTPEHVGLLAGVLDEQPDVGFVYSSCRYAGRLVLRHPVPAPARIDLGQPLFRRELFTTHLADDLPFQMMAWDWALIDSFVQQGVPWRHVDVPSFIFRLAQYPKLMVRA